MRGKAGYNVVIVALRLLVGGIFLYAGGTKIVNPQGFADSIVSFQIAPRWLISPVALGLPVFEVFVGTLLLLSWRVRAVAFSAVVLCIAFAGLLGYALIRGIDVDCGCFGGGSSNVKLSLARDAALLISAAIVYRAAGKTVPSL